MQFTECSVSICFFIQVFGERAELEQVLNEILTTHPEARVIVRFDGDQEPKEHLYSTFGENPNVEFCDEERLFTVDKGGACVQRMFELFLNGAGDVLIKIDPDTQIRKRLTKFGPPEQPWFAGTRQEQGPVQGGCILMSRAFCRLMHDSAILLSDDLKPPVVAWAFIPLLRKRAFLFGLSSYDWCLYYAANKLGLPSFNHEQVRSRWQKLTDEDFRELSSFSIVHPRIMDESQVKQKLTYGLNKTVHLSAEAARCVLNTSDFDHWNLPPALMEFLVLNVPQRSTVLELGSGKSSRELSKFYKVTSVEEDPEQVGVVAGVTYCYAPVVEGYYERTALTRAVEGTYAVVIVDGPKAFPSSRKFIRGGVVEYVKKLKGSPIIIVDDTERLSELLLCLRLAAGKKMRYRTAAHKSCSIIFPERADIKTVAAVFLLVLFAFRHVRVGKVRALVGWVLRGVGLRK